MGFNVAARHEGQAPTNGILVSDTVYAQIKGKVGADFAEAGDLHLKNIAEPVRGWRRDAAVETDESRRELSGTTLHRRAAVCQHVWRSGAGFLCGWPFEDIITTIEAVRVAGDCLSFQLCLRGTTH
jgi:hypothetical protein